MPCSSRAWVKTSSRVLREMSLLTRALPIAWCLAAGLAFGCASGGSPPGGQPSSGRPPAQKVAAAGVRTLAMNAADSYATAIEPACDPIRVRPTRPAGADWAWQTKITTSLASFTNASGTNDVECLLDMVLFATLKRHAMEEYWIPTLLHDEGKPALEIYRRAEADVWTAAARAMTREQMGELRA